MSNNKNIFNLTIKYDEIVKSCLSAKVGIVRKDDGILMYYENLNHEQELSTYEYEYRYNIPVVIIIEGENLQKRYTKSVQLQPDNIEIEIKNKG